MLNEDLYVDEVMRDVWKRKAETSKMLAEWTKNPKLRDDYEAKLRAEGWKFASPEQLAALRQKHQ